MNIERTNKETIIRISSNIDTIVLQNLIDYLSYKEATSKSKAKQTDINALAKESKKGWWAENRNIVNCRK